MKKLTMKVLCFVVCASMIIPGPWFLPSYAGTEGEGVNPETEYTEEIAVDQEEIQPQEESIVETENLEEAVKEEPKVEEKPQAEEQQPAEEQPVEEQQPAEEQATEETPSAPEYEADEIKGDYYNQYLATLLNEGKVICDNEDIELSIDKESKSMVVAGTQKKLAKSSFVIDKEYNFDGNPVNRFSIDATAGYKQKIVLGFYIDDADEPFATVKLNKKKKKDSPWTPKKNISVAVDNPGISGKHTVSFKVLETSEKNTEFAIKDIEFCESSVPVIYFDLDETDGDTIAAMKDSEDHSAECYGSMTIEVPEGCTSVDTGEALKGDTYDLEYIRGRGNSTWWADKKPYKIKLDKKADLLGLGKNKHWVLLANYYDNSLLRNKITYWLGEQMGLDFTPASEPVDVVMNGEYYGSYFLCEQIRVGENRVDIDDLEDTPEVADPPEVTGGYLLSMYPYGDEDKTSKSFTTEKGIEYLIESPEFTETTNNAQYEYIKDYVQGVENAIYGDGFKDENGVSYKDLMDIESTVKYYWFQEFSMNGDGYGSTSTYLYKPRDGKLYWGPLWDFDYVAWGSTEYKTLDTEGWYHMNNSSTWLPRLFEDQEFIDEVLAQWEPLKAALNELVKEGGKLDQYKTVMDITARYNFEKWGPTDFNRDWFDEYSEEKADTDKVELTYDEEIERLRTWINQRTEWVDKNLDDFKLVPITVTFNKYNGKKFKDVDAYEGKTIKNIPKAPERKGYIFQGWEYSFEYTLEEYCQMELGCTVAEIRELLKEFGYTDKEADEFFEELKEELVGTAMLSEYTKVHEGMVFTAKYISEKDIVPVEKIYLPQDQYYGVYEGSWSDTVGIRYSVVPFDASDVGITYSSSDESIATVTSDGDVVPHAAGDVVITVSAPNGVSASANVHFYSTAEFREAGWPEIEEIEVEEEAKVKKGEYYKLQTETDEEGIAYGSPQFISADSEIVEVDSNGVIKGIKAGTTKVFCIYYGEVSICDVTVTDSSIRKGSKVTVDGIRYEVTSMGNRIGSVKVLGPAKKSITEVTIPAEIKIKGKPYKVTEVKASAFKGCKSLKKATIGRNVQIIGKSAFRDCKKLSYIKIRAQKAKVYGGTFKNISSKAVFYVQTKAKKFYRHQLGSKKIKTFKMTDVGTVVTRSGVKYRISCMDSNKKTVSVKGLSKKSAKIVTIAKSVKIGKKTYKVTYINKTAFKNCKNLKSVTIKAPKLKNADKAFSSVSKKVKVFVPKKNLAAYKKQIKGRTVKAI